MEKLVSVLMCVYNTPVKYLKEAVNSICNQSYHHLEFIIVDDCSDNKETVDYLHALEETDARIHLIINRANLGLTKSLNIGFAQCKGDAIARMDADDISTPDRIEIQVTYLKDHPEVAMVGSRMCFIGEDGSDKGEMAVEYTQDNPEMYSIRALVQHPGPGHPTFMFRSSFIRKHQLRYDESIRKGQDYNIITHILRNGGRIDVIKRPLLKYRIHQGQISSTSFIEQLLYQSKTSYEYLKSTFLTLSESECAALSTICWYEDRIVLEEGIRRNEEMNGVCSHLTKYEKDLRKPKTYQVAIKKIFDYNGIIHQYDQHLLEEEFRFLWWKKVSRMTKEYHHIWGMNLFAARCYGEVRKRTSGKRS